MMEHPASIPRKMLRTVRALRAFAEQDAALCCGSSSCPHHRGGMAVNGPCKCYPHTHPLRDYVFAAARLRKELEGRGEP